MERKKGIPLVALIIFIGLLVAIILTCIIILGTNKNKKTSGENQIAQTPAPVEVPVEEDNGEEIVDEDEINSDSDIQAAYKITGNGKTFAKYAIYESQGFNIEDDLSDTFKLQLAMAQVTNSDMDTQSSKKSVSKDVVESYVQKVWGEDSEVEYKDFSLYSSDTNFTEQYKTTGYIYNKNNASYELNENDVTEEKPSEIPEIITKVVKYNSKIEIYVKPLFIQTIYDSDNSRYLRALYKNYNFSSKEYPLSENIMVITNDDYESVLKASYNQDVDGLNYKEVNQNIDLNQLTEYKYTLTKSTNCYNLKSFEKVEVNRPSTDDEDKEMTEQEKAKFNEKFDIYTGNGKTGNDVNKLLEQIVTSNEENTEKTDLIVEVKFNNEKISLEDDDVEALNEKISELIEKIDSDKLYNVKAIYKSAIIKSITITEENAEAEADDEE